MSKEAMRRLRARRREAGECIDCQEPSEGFARCDTCRRAHNAESLAGYYCRKDAAALDAQRGTG